MQNLKIIIWLITLSQAVVLKAGAFTEAVLQDAFEKERSLVVAKVLSVRAEPSHSVDLYYYTMKIHHLIVRGDLNPSEVDKPLEFAAGASFGKALQIDSLYALFVIRDASLAYSWCHRSDFVKIETDENETITQIESQANRVYAGTKIKAFREMGVEEASNLPEMPDELRQAFTNFREKDRDRCSFAKKIWESDFGSRRDDTHPLSSIISFLPPENRLTRSQALALLGPPTFKTGYTHKWFCGKAATDRAGVLSVEFDDTGLVKQLLYNEDSLKNWLAPAAN